MSDQTENQVILDTIDELKGRLLEDTKTDSYRLNHYSKAITSAITIAVSLTELKLFEQRSITKEEERWFQGGYQICRHFDSVEERPICDLYERLVSFMVSEK